MADDEITYDYGIRGEQWMTATSPKKPQKPQKATFELYRKRKYCPVPGCTVKKALIKLPNHLSGTHPSISLKERTRYLKVAKYMGPKEGPVQAAHVSQRCISTFFPRMKALPNTSLSEEDDPLSHKRQKRNKSKGKGKAGRKTPHSESSYAQKKGKGKAKAMNERRKILESDSSADDDLLLQKGKSAMRKIKRKAVSRARVPLVKRGKETGGKGTVKDGQLPPTSRKMGSTRQYPSFAIESSPFLTHLHAFSSSRFGLGMQLDAATELVVDVSKYLYFAGEGEQDCNNLYCTEKVMMKYLVKLEEDV